MFNLSRFISNRFYELIDEKPTYPDELVRSESSVRLDLENWGFKYDYNKKRPYFEGHERVDVVQSREHFIDYFVERIDHYYRVNEEEKPNWIFPLEKPCVLIYHDESTFRSGEQSCKRWFGPNASFFNKGKGKSWMVSDFLEAHPSGPFFLLNESEWNKAIRKYPGLLVEDDCSYIERTCSAGMIPGQDGYFDNGCILRQFERLFQMIEFKTEFSTPVRHDIEIIVDCSRNHTKMDLNINDFR